MAYFNNCAKILIKFRISMISAARFESQTSKGLGLGFRHLTVSLLVFIIFGIALVEARILYLDSL
jgi:hypothetical protein